MTNVTKRALLLAILATAARAGPYPELGIDGYLDATTWRHADPRSPEAVLNPIFRGWAAEVVEYAPADEVWSGVWNDPNRALGPATGDSFDIVSLGELSQQELEQGAPAGHITLAFGDGASGTAIRNGKGYDFAVFENAFISQATTELGSLKGQMLAELAYVEVSSDGRDFVRFPCVSLTPGPVGRYGTLDVSNIHNLAGKHPNAAGVCVGTPFDLEELADQPEVLAGRVDLNDIRYVRLADVPGCGNFLDDATAQIEPGTGPAWAPYPAAHPVYDMWPTWGSGGFDLEAVGILHEQQCSADINLDGVVDELDLTLFAGAWLSQFGGDNWNGRCDLSPHKDLFVGSSDFSTFAAQWRHVEPWRAEFK